MDLSKLEKQLFEHGCKAFERLKRDRPNDHFYSFAFFTSGEFAYAMVTASSYEGLEETVARYKTMPSFAKKSEDNLRKILKWSPCDSPLHNYNAYGLHEMNETMNQIGERFDSFDLESEGNEFAKFCAAVELTFERALKLIEAEGVFGVGTNRREVTLNLLLGDQSDEDRLEFAARVNPTEVVDRLAREFEEASAE